MQMIKSNENSDYICRISDYKTWLNTIQKSLKYLLFWYYSFLIKEYSALFATLFCLGVQYDLYLKLLGNTKP